MKTTAERVRLFYKPYPVACFPRTDGGYGIFAPNPDMSKPPCTLGIGATVEEAWKHALQRIEEEMAKP